MSRPHCRINCCTPDKIISDYFWTFESNKEKKQINRKQEISTGDGNRFFPKREENINCVFVAIVLANPDTRNK